MLESWKGNIGKNLAVEKGKRNRKDQGNIIDGLRGGRKKREENSFKKRQQD